VVAVTADSVVVELIAKTDGYSAAVNNAATTTTTAMTKIEQSASRAEAQIVRSSGQMANAQRNLGRQISDVGAQLAGGQSPFLILAQQAPQVADALADTGGKAARLATFFAGPWGAALLAAGTALGVLLEGLLKTGDSVDDLVAKLEASDQKARISSQAQAIFERSLYGAATASAEMSKRLREQNQSQIQVAQSALAAAQAQRQLSLQNLRKEARDAATTAAAARAFRVAPAVGPGGNIAGAVSAAERREAAANERLRVAQQGVRDAEKAVVEASVPVLRLQAAEAADNSARAVGRHTRAVDDLTGAYRRAQAEAAKLGGAAGNAARARAVATYRAGLAAEDRQFEAERDAIRDSNRKPRKDGSAAKALREAQAEARKEAALIQDIRADLVGAFDEVDKLIFKSASDLQREAAARVREVFGDLGDPLASYRTDSGEITGTDRFDREREAEVLARTDAENRAQDVRENNVRSLAFLYENLFQQGTDGVWRNFKDQGLRALALILAQATVTSFGAGGGGFGSLLGNIGKAAGAFSGGGLGGLFGRASGGYVAPGQVVRVNEQRPGVELLRMGSQGGEVIPLGQTSAVARPSPATIVNAPQFNLRGAIITRELYADMQRISNQSAAAAGQAAYRQAVRDAPGAVGRAQRFGTS
jgi:hypothetical protein